MLRDRMIAIAAERLGGVGRTTWNRRGRVRVEGLRQERGAADENCGDRVFLPQRLPAGRASGAGGQRALYAPSARSNWANAATCAPARWTSTTGAVTLLRYIVSEDCGPMINPNVVEGQIAGGVVQGIGGVLFEHLPYDEEGNPLATTFMDYLLPTSYRGAGDRVRARRDPRRPGPGASREWARAARSVPRRPWSTPSPTRWLL